MRKMTSGLSYAEVRLRLVGMNRAPCVTPIRNPVVRPLSRNAMKALSGMEWTAHSQATGQRGDAMLEEFGSDCVFAEASSGCNRSCVYR